MICNPKLILYASVSKGTLILSEFSSGDPDLETLALQCLELAPALHTMFTHIVDRRIYTFLMEDPFVFFVIFEEELGKPQGLWFLNRVKDAFSKILKSKSIENFDNLTANCFHDELCPIFHSLMGLPTPRQARTVLSPEIPNRVSRNTSMDLTCGKKVISIPLLGKTCKCSKKKKKIWNFNGKDSDLSLEKNVNQSDDSNTSREFSVASQKHDSYMGNGVRPKAQRMWRQHVWVVVILDLFVCCVLFGVWLWICRGFKCMGS